MQRDALAIKCRLLGSEHISVSYSLADLADVLANQGKPNEAEPMFREVLAMQRKLLGAEHPRVASNLDNLAAVLLRLGRLTDAETFSREALALQKKLLGSEHPDVAHSLHTLAGILQGQARRAEAEPLYREALAIRKKALGSEHSDVAVSLGELGRLLDKQGKPAEAEPLVRECLAILDKKMPGDWTTFEVQSLLGGTLLAQRKYAEAEPLLLSSCARLKQRQDKIPADANQQCLKETLERLARLYEATGRAEQAAEWKTETLKWYRKAADEGNVEAQFGLGLMYERGEGVAKDAAEALKWYRKAAESGDALGLNGLAWILATCGDAKIRDGLTAVTFAEKAVAKTNRKNAAILDTLAAAYAEVGQFDKAINVQKEAIDLSNNDTLQKELVSPQTL